MTANISLGDVQQHHATATAARQHAAETEARMDEVLARLSAVEQVPSHPWASPLCLPHCVSR